MIRSSAIAVVAVLCSMPAWAAPSDPNDLLFRHRTIGSVWTVDFAASAAPPALVIPESVSLQPVHAAAIQHSDAYLTRAKIHRYASYASLPLFGAEVLLGESLYNSGATGNKGPHIAVGTALVALFGLNTVTGGWNLFGSEGRSDRQDRTIKVIHGLLMMAADAGFVATVATAPHSGHRFIASPSQMTLHRNVALFSIGVGTAGYLLMFIHSL
jgi:hypothetical protein